MLNNLYRKLHILFASSVMLIITLVISFVVANTVHTEKINESILFQRLTTLLIYQVESASSDMDKSLKAYEKSYHIFSLISDTKGNTIYRSVSRVISSGYLRYTSSSSAYTWFKWLAFSIFSRATSISRLHFSIINGLPVASALISE